MNVSPSAGFADLPRPQQRARLGVEREQVAVGRAADHAAVLDRHAAIALKCRRRRAICHVCRHFTRQVAASSAIVLVIVVTYIVPL